MLKCKDDKCKTGEVTASACRKRATATGIYYACPGCGGALEGRPEHREPEPEPEAQPELEEAYEEAYEEYDAEDYED